MTPNKSESVGKMEDKKMQKVTTEWLREQGEKTLIF